MVKRVQKTFYQEQRDPNTPQETAPIITCSSSFSIMWISSWITIQRSNSDRVASCTSNSSDYWILTRITHSIASERCPRRLLVHVYSFAAKQNHAVYRTSSVPRNSGALCFLRCFINCRGAPMKENNTTHTILNDTTNQQLAENIVIADDLQQTAANVFPANDIV